MSGKLVLAGAVIAALASPAIAGDFSVRARSQAYVQQERVYGPGEIAAGAVAGAVGMAAAIATAPFAPRPYAWPADSYAYYDGPYEPYNSGPVVTYNESYMARGDIRPVYRGGYWNDPVGPICQPGTLVRLADGQSYLCQ